MQVEMVNESICAAGTLEGRWNTARVGNGGDVSLIETNRLRQEGYTPPLSQNIASIWLHVTLYNHFLAKREI